MNISREAKSWKTAEVQINQASEFLNKPKLYSLQEFPVESYENNTREKELIKAMLELENIAKNNGCKSGFWRRIKKVAVQLKLEKKIEEYESEFHTALSKNIT